VVSMVGLVLYTPAAHYLLVLSFVDFAGTFGTASYVSRTAPDTFIAAMSVSVHPVRTAGADSIRSAAAKLTVIFIINVLMYLIRAARTNSIRRTSTISAI
ncbi:MAG: hypothetical protein IKX46_08720, partial [Verrucomicrobia bacterium]|nr:hypothetical protein [Verrucomicrobiota bacterium]